MDSLIKQEISTSKSCEPIKRVSINIVAIITIKNELHRHEQTSATNQRHTTKRLVRAHSEAHSSGADARYRHGSGLDSRRRAAKRRGRGLGRQ